MVWIIIVIVIVGTTITSYRWIDKIQYQNAYQEINLEEIAEISFDMSESFTPYWLSVTNKIQAENNAKSLNYNLPDIDFNKDMLIISYGTELLRLRYNLRESTFKTRGKYIGFPCFKQEEAENIVFIYRANLIPLMDTDVAGYPPGYKGRYQ